MATNCARFVIAALITASALFGGCTRQEGDAIVLDKEHIAAAAPTPALSAKQEPVGRPDNTTRELARDEIVVDGVVMKARDRGTSHDPRAMKDEQWIVKVSLVDGGRIFDVLARREQFEKLKPGDRVHVRCQVGKYTGTVWGSELDRR